MSKTLKQFLIKGKKIAGTNFDPVCGDLPYYSHQAAFICGVSGVEAKRIFAEAFPGYSIYSTVKVSEWDFLSPRV